MSESRSRRTDSGECFGASEELERRFDGDLEMENQEEEVVVMGGRGGPYWWSVVVALVLLVLSCITGCAEGQCDGSPLYLGPRNSSVHVAFPEVNWDAHSGSWNPYQFYPTAVHCTWVVRAPAAHVLAATFLHFDTEQDYDFVTIYSSEARTEQLLRVSGDLTGDWLVTSPEDTLVIDFVSDEYTTYYGFLLAYRYEPRACVEGGVTVTEDQLIALPTLNLRGVLPGPGGDDITLSPATKSKPKKLQMEVPKGGARWQVRAGGSWVARAHYPTWVNCTWRVAVSPRQVVELEVLRFSTPERDLLTVWEVGAGGARPLLQHGGGDVPPRRAFRSSRPLLITFLAQSGEGGVGFLLDLTYITRACDPPLQELGAPRGLVGYPHYNLLLGEGGNQQEKRGTPAWRKEEDHGRGGGGGGAVHYGPDSCRWVVRAPPGYTLNLTVLHLDTRPQDPLKVVEGDALVFALSGGLPAKRSFVSQGSEVTLKFDPQEDTDKTGFLLQYSWLLEECGGEVKFEGSGQVKSPFYPDTYGPNVTCQWKLTPPPGHLLHLLVTRLKLDAGDALQVTDGDKDLKVTWDPNNPASRLLELRPDPSVSLFFSSDSQHNEGYFLIKYAAFTLGSCGFDLSPCGWTTVDPLQAWAFHPYHGMMVVAEDSASGLQLPRGYRAILVSPWVTPLADTPTTTSGGLEHVCLKFDYLLEGPDVFMLSAWLVQEDSDQRSSLSASPLAFVYGPHGNRTLTAAVNFTVPAAASFRVLVKYERGYGPNYRAGVGGVWVGRGRQCGRELDHLRATSCNFTRDLCGWTNTHTDHTNWLLTEHGAEAEVHGGFEDSDQQWADLTSPVVARGDLRKKEEQEKEEGEEEKEREEGEGGAACLSLLYRMFSGNTELRVVLRRLSAAGAEEGQEEEVLWSQGRVESPGVLQALVNLPQVLPSQYQLVLRAVGVGGAGGRGAGGGVAVQAARLEAGRCSGGAACSFDSGFCSWKVSYTGGTVWYIKPHQGEEGSHAAVLVGGAPGDSTCLISETIPSSPHARAFTFRYKVTGTSRCLSVAQRVVSDRGTTATTTNTTTTSTITVWSQCRGKGQHWLYECVTLPPSALPYQVVLKATADEDSTEVWIDDVQLFSGTCNSTLPQDTLGSGVYNTGFGSYSPLNSLTLSSGLDIPSGAPGGSSQGGLTGPPQWRCEPRGSLCGMTQPSTGHRDWVYVEATRPGLHLNVSSTTTTPTTTTTTTTPRPGAFPQPGQHACRDGSPLQEEWFCDGVEDCPDRSDEEDCECVREPGQTSCGMASSTPDLNLGSGVCALDAFNCPAGRACPPGGCEAGLGSCIPRAWLCDGVEHCVGGEDEAACVGVSRPAQREAANDVDEPEPVVAEVDVAAAAAAAARAAVETRPEISPSEAAAAAVAAAAVAAAATKVLECSGGLLVPLTWRCDGRKDCPLDGLDEMGCAYCSAGEFICPHSGVCVPRGQVCDGAASIPSCSDELFCEACPPAHFACDVCVPSWQICDGVWNCENGEDERECTGVGVGLGVVEAGMRTKKKDCSSSEPYRCPSGLCLPESAVCDRHLDCPDGNDEKNCLDDNFDVPRYISVSTSSVSRGQSGDSPSRLVTPQLEQPVGMAGVLAFKYRLDTWTGPSNLTLTLEMVSGEDSLDGMRACALWRQSGHKGREWLTENVLVPPVPGVTKYKLAFLLTDHHHYHGSQQVHLSHLSFRAAQPRALNPLGAEMLSCEFADSLCGWSQPSVHHGYSWVYARASPHTRRTGPITGFPGEGDSGFVFADSLYGSEGSTADLLSPPLMLPSGPEVSICFRFALFLYGSQVSQVSVLALQHLPSRTHTTQLYMVAGGRGLSWVPASVTVRAEHIEDMSLPLVLAVRARRGPGPEGDIALDHLSVLAGPCHLHPSLQPNITLHPTLTHPDALALTAGPALTPLPARDPPDDPSHPSEDSCTAHSTCSSCVAGQGAGVQPCTWCDLTQRCVGGRSPAAAACPRHLAVHHNTSEAEERRGPGWCPQLTPQQDTRVLVAAGSSPVLSFSVTNIQATQTDSGWSCVFESIEEDSEEEEGKREDEEEGKTHAEGHGKGRAVEEDEAAEEGRKQKEEEEAREEGGESEFDFKRRRRRGGEKKSAEEVREVNKETLRLPGFFQGRVFTVGGPSGVGVGVRQGVGVGVIRCGDGVSELRPAQPRPHAHYSVKLLTPAGAAIDNPARVKLEVYSCGQLSSSSCPSCVAVNATYSCGWCVVAQACTIHAHCPGASWVGPGRSCDLEEQRKTQGEDISGLGTVGEELLGLGEPLHHLGEHTKSDLDLDLAGGLLGGADQPALTRDEEEDEDEAKTNERRRGKRKKAQQLKSGGSEDGQEVEEEEEEEEGEDGEEEGSEGNSADEMQSNPGPRRGGRGKKRAGRKSLKGKLKVTGRGRSFLRLPQHPGLYVARDTWRLHTGRQYYIPVSKKTLVNLGFVRQVTFGSLAQEKTRTVLINGTWKKAAGYYVDLYEKVDNPPVTSLITTSRSVFEQLMAQLSTDQ